MNRFVLFVLLLAGNSVSAQITWISECTDKTFCLNQNTCVEGDVFMAEQAVTGCFNGPNINYSYRIDLFNNGGPADIQSSEDTITGTFPIGTHQVIWRANDNCGNAIQCTYLFTIKDCFAPNLLCINSISRSLESNCLASIDAEDFVVSATDNCTPDSMLVYGIRKAGQGTGFPAQTNLTYDACELGPQNVEVWVKDENDLFVNCLANVIIEDNSGNCDCPLNADIGLQGCARTADSAKLENYTIRATLMTGPASTVLEKTVTDSCYSGAFNVPMNSSHKVVLRAKRNDDHLAGVSTFDMLQTAKHILNLQPFQTMYQWLAADVNASGSVTTFDIVETRKLILGIYDSFPAVPSWRFIRPLANPGDLMSAVKDTYQLTAPNLIADTIFTGLDFVGIKMGDANLSANFGGNDTDDRSPLTLTAADRFLAAGETASIPIRLTETAILKGWQLAVAIDPASAVVEAVEGLPEGQFHVAGNELRALWFDPEGRRIVPEDALFSLRIKALRPVLVSELITLSEKKLVAEAYGIAPGGGEERRRLTFQAGAQAQEGVAFFPPHPNPFGDEARFGLLLSRPAEVRLELFDIAGRRVLTRQIEMGAGRQSFVLRAGDLPGKGLFFYRMQANGEVLTGLLAHD